MQKLVMISLKENNQTSPRRCADEFLQEELADGWRIVSVTATSAGLGEHYAAVAWFAVVLDDGRPDGPRSRS